TRVETHLRSLTRLARLESADYASDAPPESAQIVLGEAVFAPPLAGVTDIAADRARLLTHVRRADAERRELDRKPANEQFVAKAPPEVIEEQRQRRAEAVERRNRRAEALARLS